MAQDDSKPDETASSTLGPPAGDQDPDTEVTRSDAMAATASHKPTGPLPTPHDEVDEYMLEREPDGRYRSVGRQRRRREIEPVRSPHGQTQAQR